jgi:hypothetical protein
VSELVAATARGVDHDVDEPGLRVLGSSDESRFCIDGSALCKAGARAAASVL